MTTNNRLTSVVRSSLVARLTDRLVEISITVAVALGLAAVLTGALWLLARLFRLVWKAAELSYTYITAIGWTVAAALVCFAVFEALSHATTTSRAAPTPSAPGGSRAKPRRRRTRGLLCAGVAVIITSGNLCLNIAASRVEAHYQSRKLQGVDIYKNHDLAKLVGQCVRLAILRHATTLPAGDERDDLESIAAIAPARWAAMTDTQNRGKADPRVLALADTELLEFIQEPKAEALNQANWASLLDEWRTMAKAETVTAHTLHSVSSTIAKDFGVTLREALKADFERGGKAWAAMQLDIAQRLLNRTSVSAGVDNATIAAALAEVKSMLAEDARSLPALNRTILDARQAQDEHARTVSRHYEQIAGLLAQLREDLTNIKTDVAATRAGMAAVQLDVREVWRDTGDLKTGVNGLVDDLESRKDPVRKIATHFGIDIDAVSASDFHLQYIEQHGRMFIRVRPKRELLQLLPQANLEARIGTRPWKILFVNSLSGEIEIYLDPKDIEEDGPVQLRFGPHDPDPTVRSYGPYDFDLWYSGAHRQQHDDAIDEAKKWAASTDWIRSDFVGYWEHNRELWEPQGRFIQAIEIGRRPENPELILTIPKVPPSKRMSVITGTPHAREGDPVDVVFATTVFFKKIERLRNESILFGRLQFVDQTWSEWREFRSTARP